MAQNMKNVEAKKFGFDPGKPNLFASPAVMVFLLLVMLVKVEPNCASGHQSWRKRKSNNFFSQLKEKVQFWILLHLNIFLQLCSQLLCHTIGPPVVQLLYQEPAKGVDF